MGNERYVLLATLVAEAAANGLRDRSLRELARATGTSHPRLLYHFGSRQGLVAAVVAHVEASERAVFRELASSADTSAELIRALWRHMSATEMRPLIRLFFEAAGAPAASGGPAAGGREENAEPTGSGATKSAAAVGVDPWLEEAGRALRELGEEYERDLARLGLAVIRGLLVDVLTTGDTAAATRSLERFVADWFE